MTPSWEEFVKLGPLPLIGVRLPSGEVEMSPRLLEVLHLDSDSQPRSLEQWGELWHPSDHAKALELNEAIRGQASVLSLSRRLYCGDGIYRPFRLDAAIGRDEDGTPAYLMGTETPVGPPPAPRAPAFDETEAEVIARLQAVDEAAEEENVELRHILQRHVLRGLAEPIPHLPPQEPEVRIGMAGLRGSGKSALVNALMGERLLPEGAHAAGLTLLCRGGDARFAELRCDGRRDRAEGRALTPRWMAERLLERGSPGEEAGVAELEWTSPSALLPPGVLLVLSGEGTMPLAPRPEVVLYVTPIRARLRAEELERLRAILDGGGRLVLVLSQIDLEEDEGEAGRVLLSRGDRLERTIRGLREDLRPLFPDPSIIPVSSRWALRNLYNRSSQEWRAGNFGALLGCISRLASREAPNRSLEGVRRPEGLIVSGEPRREGEPELVGSLLTSVREQGLRARFLALPALKGRRRFLLLGSRQDGLKLLSRLAHDANLEDREAGSWDWFFAGRTPPFPCLRLPELPDDLELLLAPSDAFLGDVDWEGLMAEWTPVVQVNVARLDAGLADLARAPYREALSQVPRWVLASAHGGLLRGRLPELALAPERARTFMERLAFRGQPDWFIHENYDPRYTDFLSLARRAGTNFRAGDIAALVGLWDAWGLDYAPPFSRGELGMALLGILDQRRKRRDDGEWRRSDPAE